jgi:hypothetical protein
VYKKIPARDSYLPSFVVTAHSVRMTHLLQLGEDGYLFKEACEKHQQLIHRIQDKSNTILRQNKELFAL